MLKKILYGLLGILVVIQFFGIDKSAPVTDQSNDFITINDPPVEVSEILQTVCYDCHSYKTIYPWYSNIQPVGWWLADHVEHARSHLNFSTWNDEERQKHKISECIEKVHEGEMPLNSYTWAHSEARLTDEQRGTLVTWFKTLPHEEEHDQ